MFFVFAVPQRSTLTPTGRVTLRTTSRSYDFLAYLCNNVRCSAQEFHQQVEYSFFLKCLREHRKIKSSFQNWVWWGPIGTSRSTPVFKGPQDLLCSF